MKMKKHYDGIGIVHDKLVSCCQYMQGIWSNTINKTQTCWQTGKQTQRDARKSVTAWKHNVQATWQLPKQSKQRDGKRRHFRDRRRPPRTSFSSRARLSGASERAAGSPPYINSTQKNANSETFLLCKSSTLGSFSCCCCRKAAFCHEARDVFIQMQKTNITCNCKGQKNSGGTRQRHLFIPADKAARH